MTKADDKEVVGVMQAERRIARRFPASLVVLFMWDGRLTQATAEDVSMSGMRLSTEVDLHVGLRLNAHFAPKGGSETFELGGEVVWSRPSDEMIGLFYAGLEFGELPQRTIDQLAKVVRQIGGDTHEHDDLPILGDDAIMVVDEEPDKFQGEPTPTFRPLSAPLGTETPDADGHAFDEVRSSQEAWSVGARLQLALAEDIKKREDDRKRGKDLADLAKKSKKDGNLEKAVQLLRQAVELVPDSSDYLEALAETLYLTGETRASARLFDRALRLRMESKD